MGGRGRQVGGGGSAGEAFPVHICFFLKTLLQELQLVIMIAADGGISDS